MVDLNEPTAALMALIPNDLPQEIESIVVAFNHVRTHVGRA
jgi:hypothetical protein